MAAPSSLGDRGGGGPTPSSSSTNNTIDATSRVIADADTKFEEKLRLVKSDGGGASFVVYPDRSFSLRQQVAHLAALMSDVHFAELLGDVERCMTPEYATRPEPDKKLHVFLATLVKHMLRDMVASPNAAASSATSSFAARKVQVEMVWQWWSDKQGEILDFALATKAKAAAATAQVVADKVPKPPTGSPSKPMPPAGGGATNTAAAVVSGPTVQDLLPDEKWSQEPLHPVGGSSLAVRPLTYPDDASSVRDQSTVKRRLALFKRRDLVKSETFRVEQMQQQTWARRGDTGEQPNPPAARIVLTKEARNKRAQSAGGWGVGGRSNSTAMGSSFFSATDPRATLIRSGGIDASRPMTSSGVDLWRGQNNDDVELHGVSHDTHARILHHLVHLTDQARDQRVARDVIATFAFNQARLDEETARRVESDTYASQTGRTCHTRLRRPTAEAPPKPSASLDVDTINAMLGRVVYQGGDASFSPYDNYRPRPIDERRLQEMLSKLTTVDDRVTDLQQRFGLSSPHPGSVAASSVRGEPLDLVPSATLQVSAAMPRVDAPLVEQLFPFMATEEAEAPSLSRQKQLRLVDRIRAAFARNVDAKGNPAPIGIPRAVLERAIVSPQDRPIAECMRLLPLPGCDYPANPNPAGNAGAGDKKGKKGDGKKKGKSAK